MAHHIFFSYSRKNSDQAAVVINKLRASGFVVWQDVSDIHATEDWTQKIGAGLDEAALVVVLWSKAASESKWVKQEIDSGIARSKPITLLLLDSTPLPIMLSATQGITAGSIDQAVKTLVADLVRLYPTLKRRRVGFEFGKALGDLSPTRSLPMLDGKTLVWVPLIESGYCKASIVGTADTIVNYPSVIQVCLQFTQQTTSSFMPNVYQHWTESAKDAERDTTPAFTAVCITSPINSEDKYELDNRNNAQWSDAIDTTREAILPFAEVRKPTLQFFSLAPAALLLPLGTYFWRFYHIQMYNRVGNGYERVVEIWPDGT